MYNIKILSKDDIMQVMKMKPVIESVEDVYCQKSQEEAVAWPTIFYEFDPGKADMDIKSGWLRNAGLFGHKTVSWFGANKEKGLPDLVGVIVVYNAETGLPIGILDASYITGIRTGAAGAVGAKYLARKDAKNLFILGAGNQAAFQIAATLTALPQIEKIMVADMINPENGERFVAALPQRLKEEFSIDASSVEFVATTDLKDALSQTDIVITVTPSKTPVIKKEWVKPGTHFSCIGSDMSGKEEIQGEILVGARIFVDDKPHCIEAGEIEIPLNKGLISEEDIVGEMGDLILGKVPGRQNDEEITVYDACGMALLDIAAAKAALDLAAEKKLGATAEL